MLAAAPLSLVKMILDGSHLHSLSGGGPVLGAAATAPVQLLLLQTVCSCFLPLVTSAPVRSSVNKRNYFQFLLTTLHILWLDVSLYRDDNVTRRC